MRLFLVCIFLNYSEKINLQTDLRSKFTMQKTLALVITSPPNSNLTTTAINLISAAIKENIKVIGVFFYQDGVLNAANNLHFPNDEYQTQAEWVVLNKQYNIPLFLCNTAAEKRGLMVEDYSIGTNKVRTIHNAFTPSGLGELAQLTASADRMVQL